MRVRIGSLEELRSKGCLTGKAGSQPVCVFWHEGRAFAVDDRCPHLGFPLHRGTVENGLLTCHWHHARFELSSGSTFTPFSDDVRAYPVELTDGEVTVVVNHDDAGGTYHRHRLVEGLEAGLTLVTAKATLGLVDDGVSAEEIVGIGVDFGTTYREAGWGAGLTVLIAMANVLPYLDPDDRSLALVHGLSFVSRDTRGRPPRFPLTPLGSVGVSVERLEAWYRRFIESRSVAGAERVLLTAVDAGAPTPRLAAMMTAAATDHVFLDGGHTLDFTNKAFEALGLLGGDRAAQVLPTLVVGTARAGRAEELASWRHPRDLIALIDAAVEDLDGLVVQGRAQLGSWDGVAPLAWAILGDDPEDVVSAITTAITAGASPEQLGRAVAYAGALRITRFHVQNDHGDWDVVHHAFTAANALHQALLRSPTTTLLRGVLHGAMRVYLDRFLNVPAARSPTTESGNLDELARCWDEQGRIDDAGALAYGYLRGGGEPAASWPPSAAHSWPKTPASTGTRPTKRRCASTTPGHPARRKEPSSWPAAPASSPLTPLPDASCPTWCAQPPACAEERPSTKALDCGWRGARGWWLGEGLAPLPSEQALHSPLTAPRRFRRKTSGWSRAGSSAASSMTRSGQP